MSEPHSSVRGNRRRPTVPLLPAGAMIFALLTVSTAATASYVMYIAGRGFAAFRITRPGPLHTFIDTNPGIGDIGCRVDAEVASPDGRTIYVGCTKNKLFRTLSSSLMPFSIQADGKILPQQALRVPLPALPLAASLSRRGDTLYMSTSAGILQYRVAEGKRPTLLPWQSARSIVAGPVVPSPNGKYACAMRFSENVVFPFRIQSDGGLVPLSTRGILSGAGPTSPCYDRDGHFLYCVDSKACCVDRFAVYADGSLERLLPAALNVPANPDSLALSPNGRYACTASFDSKMLTTYRVGKDGAFNLMKSTNVIAQPTYVRFAPNGHEIFALSYFAVGVGRFTMSADGRLTPATPLLQSAGDTPHDILFVNPLHWGMSP